MKLISILFGIMFMTSAILILSSEKNKRKVSEPTISDFGLIIYAGDADINKEISTKEQEAACKIKFEVALQTGYDILSKGGSSLDAVEKVLKTLEDSLLFRPGKVAVTERSQAKGLAAAVMDGSTLMSGSVVVRIKHVKNPISLARALMENKEEANRIYNSWLLKEEESDMKEVGNPLNEIIAKRGKSKHVSLPVFHAEKFAKEQGLEMVDDETRFWLEENDKTEKAVSTLDLDKDYKYGAMGCAALDKNGNLAAGTSKISRSVRSYGSIHYAWIIGAGTYANNATCALSAIGQDAFFDENIGFKDILALMENEKMPFEQAAYILFDDKIEANDYEGVVIGIDKNGGITSVFNTEGMFLGYIKDDGKKFVEFYPEGEIE